MDVKQLGTQTLDACRKRGWAVLETGISRPVPQIVNSQVHLGYLLYRSQARPPYQMIYEPFARVVVDYASGEIIDYQPLPTADPVRALGRYPHAAAAAVPRDQWQGGVGRALWSLSSSDRCLRRPCQTRPTPASGPFQRIVRSDHAALSGCILPCSQPGLLCLDPAGRVADVERVVPWPIIAQSVVLPSDRVHRFVQAVVTRSHRRAPSPRLLTRYLALIWSYRSRGTRLANRC